MTTTRQLAAILAADDAGYSRLFGAGEGGTLVDGHQSRRHCQVDILADPSRLAAMQPPPCCTRTPH